MNNDPRLLGFVKSIEEKSRNDLRMLVFTAYLESEEGRDRLLRIYEKVTEERIRYVLQKIRLGEIEVVADPDNGFYDKLHEAMPDEERRSPFARQVHERILYFRGLLDRLAGKEARPAAFLGEIRRPYLAAMPTAIRDDE